MELPRPPMIEQICLGQVETVLAHCVRRFVIQMPRVMTPHVQVERDLRVVPGTLLSMLTWTQRLTGLVHSHWFSVIITVAWFLKIHQEPHQKDYYSSFKNAILKQEKSSTRSIRKLI